MAQARLVRQSLLYTRLLRVLGNVTNLSESDATSRTGKLAVPNVLVGAVGHPKHMILSPILATEPLNPHSGA